MLYRIQILPSVVKKDLVHLPKSDVHKITKRIEQLGVNPRPLWSKRLTNREEYRARQGNYQILYVIEDTVKIVKVVKIGHRRDVYN